MPWTANWYPGALLAGGVVNAGLALVVWRNRDRRAAVPACGLFLAMSGWAFADAVRLGFHTYAAQFLWYRVGVTFAGVVGTLWFAFAVTYAGYGEWLTRRVAALLSVKPVLYVTLAWTNGAHHLVWSDVDLVAAAVPPNLAFEFGPLYLVHIGYAYLLVVGGIAVLVPVVWRSSAVYRRPTALAVAAVVPPMAANVAFAAKLTPPSSIDFTPLAFAVTGALFAVALFEFDLLNRTPVAREQVIATLGTGLAVVDPDGAVVHANDVARTVVPGLAEGADAAAALDVDAVDEADGDVVAVEVDDGKRVYDIHVAPLRDFRDREVGAIVALQDVTERRRYEQRLEVTNRLLRHNVRNETAKILGWAENVRAAATDEAVVDAAADIERVARDLGDLGSEARHIETTLDVHGGDTAPLELTPLLEDVVAEVRGEWPSATVTLSAPEDVAVRARDPPLLDVAVQNLIENGIEHADADAPTVQVTVRRRDGTVVVEVADDGPGLPDIERETLRQGSETPLRHSQGLGLWLTYWTLEGIGGDIDFLDDDQGTTVRVALETPG